MQALKTTLPSATVAAETVESGRYAKAQKQLQNVETMIRDTIAKGQRSISDEGVLEPPVVKTLRDLGYLVNSSSARNETYWSISW